MLAQNQYLICLKKLRILKTTSKKALKRGIKKARPGNTTGDIGNTVQRYVESQGFNVVRELCGHGIGKDLHEDPKILNYGKRRAGEELKEGMVICIEPMVTAGDYKLEKLDILINAAGVGVYKEIEDVELREWTDSLAINTTAPFYMTKMLLPLLRKSEKSVIINIGSGMGKIPTACRSVYCATKYALRGMTLSLAAEFQGTNVNFVHIALGSTLTEFGPMTLKEKEEESLKGKAYFTPEWVAKKFVEIIEKEQFEGEIELYPSEYTGKEWRPS